MKYFVLKPKGTNEQARASRNAMRAYAQTMYAAGEREFGNDLMEWVEREETAAEIEEDA